MGVLCLRLYVILTDKIATFVHLHAYYLKKSDLVQEIQTIVLARWGGNPIPDEKTLDLGNLFDVSIAPTNSLHLLSASAFYYLLEFLQSVSLLNSITQKLHSQ